jgi:hypothetical protein
MRSPRGLLDGADFRFERRRVEGQGQLHERILELHDAAVLGDVRAT